MRCTYGFHAPDRCPANPWCSCVSNLPKPMPDPEQMDIYDVLGEDGRGTE